MILSGTTLLRATPSKALGPAFGAIICKSECTRLDSIDALIPDRSPGGGGYGQNIAAGTEAGQIAKVLTGGFYNNEMMDYPKFGVDSPDMTNFEKWGHFSQMVWKGTQKVGCYTFTCSPAGAPPLDCNPATGQSYLKNTGCGNGGMEAIFTVCNYSPAGTLPLSCVSKHFANICR